MLKKICTSQLVEFEGPCYGKEEELVGNCNEECYGKVIIVQSVDFHDRSAKLTTINLCDWGIEQLYT